MNMILASPVAAVDCKFAYGFRNTGVNDKSLVIGLDSQYGLRDIHKGSSGCSSKPAIFGFPVFDGIPSGYHLGVYVRLCAVELADFF